MLGNNQNPSLSSDEVKKILIGRISWQDRVRLIIEFHEYMMKEHGQNGKGRPRKKQGNNGWSISRTCQVLRIGFGSFYTMRKLAEVIEHDRSYDKLDFKMAREKLNGKS